MENELLEETGYVGDIPEGWKWMKVEEFAEVVSGGTPRTDKPEFWNGDIAWITPKDLSNFKFRYIERGERNISREGLENSNAKLLPKGTVLLSSRAPVGYLAIAKNELSTNQGFQSLIPKENVISEFLYYLLKNNVEYLKSQASGTTFGELSKSTLKKLTFPLPPLPEQKAIAEVLSSIDDKIELLHRQNKTLEEMAMTLFRQWFIEPTKDGLPDGWEEVSLEDIFDIGIGRTPPRKESHWFSLNPKDIRWISVKDLGSIDTYIINTSEFLKEEAIKKFNIPIIPDNTVILSFKLTVERVGITIGEMVSNEAIAHFKPKPNSKISSNYLYLFLKTLDFSTFGSTSSIAEAINSKIIKEIKIQIPDDESILSFQSLIDPIFQKIRHNVFQIQTLEKLRDTLLPKLMSGEIRVKI
jgi:type I restriction enzyme S subunit